MIFNWSDRVFGRLSEVSLEPFASVKITYYNEFPEDWVKGVEYDRNVPDKVKRMHKLLILHGLNPKGVIAVRRGRKGRKYGLWLPVGSRLAATSVRTMTIGGRTVRRATGFKKIESGFLITL